MRDHLKKLFSIVFVFLVVSGAWAQDSERIYDPEADAAADIAAAVRTAQAGQKHILLQIGGNWCKWCIRLHRTMKADARVDSLLNADFILVYVNFGRENKNLDVLAELGSPQRFGFPVLLILNAKGDRLHTQDSSLLESGDGHDTEKIYRFLALWTPAAVVPAK